MDDHYSFGPRRGPCVVCGQAGPVCARCRVAFYCGKEHQKQHWKLHKPTCGCLEVRVDERVGRHIVAVKDIPMRTVLMRELPLVVYPTAPAMHSQRKLHSMANLIPSGIKMRICVACCMMVDKPVPCVHCGFPLCKRSCPNLARHSPECAAFQTVKYKYPGDISALDDVYVNLISSVRIWLASRNQDERGIRLLRLQPDDLPTLFADIGTVEAASVEKVIKYILTKVFLTADFALRAVGSFASGAQEGLRRAAAAAAINSFGLNGRKGECRCSGAALYSGLSLLESSCLPNARTAQASADSEEVLLIASRNIAAGERVTISSCNDNPLATRSERWLDNAFECSMCRCELCEDPTERGTYFNAWCCTTCKSKDLKSLVTLVGAFGWRCGVCKASGQHVDPAVQELEKSFRHLQSLMVQSKNPEETQRLWQQYIDDGLWPKGPLHPTHRLVVKARAELLTLGDNMCCTRRTPATHEEAAFLLDHCKSLLSVLDALRPPTDPYRREVVMNLYRLTMHKLMLHCRQRQDNETTVSTTIDTLKEEVSALLAQIRHISISPCELEACEKLQKTFDSMMPILLK